MNATMKEVKPGTYVIPEIDNRQRRGCAMWRAAMYHDIETAVFTTLTGETKKVTFDAFGWRVE